jgi:hypothetical protein
MYIISIFLFYKLAMKSRRVGPKRRMVGRYLYSIRYEGDILNRIRVVEDGQLLVRTGAVIAGLLLCWEERALLPRIESSIA